MCSSKTYLHSCTCSISGIYVPSPSVLNPKSAVQQGSCAGAGQSLGIHSTDACSASEHRPHTRLHAYTRVSAEVDFIKKGDAKKRCKRGHGPHARTTPKRQNRVRRGAKFP